MSRLLQVAFLIIGIAASWQLILATPDKNSAVLLEESFDSAASPLASRLIEHELISLARNRGPDGSDAIRVSYVGYERGSKRVVVRFPLADAVTAATLSYDVCFESDFIWVLGGKLHGLGPKTPVTGGRPRHPEKWSARVTFKSDGHCATYLYDQHPDKTYGIGDTSPVPVFKKGQWHRVTLEVKLNDAGVANGHARISVDGREVVFSKKIKFRESGVPDTDIQLFLFSTFHGGSSPRHAPVDEAGNTVTVHALFDNLQVTEGISKG
ncbi:MAG: polysaccharide lyase [Puniceicoccaceae bacterium]